MRTVNRSFIFALCVIALVAITDNAAAQAGGRISGKVEDQTGKPIKGVQVTAISPALESFKAEKTTNKKGKFVLAFTDSTASYVIELKKEGYQTIVAPVDPVPGQTRMVEYVLLPEQGEEQAAAQALERVLQADPNHARAHYLLGVAQFNTGQTETATEHLQRFLELTPDDPDAAVARDLLSYSD